MKKNIVLWMVLVLCVALLAACGKKDSGVDTGSQMEDTVTEKEQETTEDTESEDNTTEDATTEDSAETEDTVDDEDVQDPVEDENVTDDAETEDTTVDTQEPEVEDTITETEQPETEDTTTETEQPETQEPVEEDTTMEQPEEEGDTSDNEGTAAADVDLTAIFDALANAYGEYFIPNMLMNAANEYELETINMMVWVADENGDGVGLSADLYDEYLVAVPMIGFHPDTIIMVKAKEGKMPEVHAFLEELKESKVDPMNNYPSNLPKQEAIRMETYGDYVFFYTLGAPNEEETDEAALLDYYTQQNQIASDIIAGFFK